MHRQGEEGAPHGSAIFAREQVGARGTRGRSWQAPAGGLWLSVLLRGDPVAGVEVLSLRVGLTVARALEGDGQLPAIGLKWPNDLILDDRKVGGILCEARWRGDRLAWVAVGVGINVRNPVPAEVRMTATRLADHGFEFTPDQLAEPVRQAVAGVDLQRPALIGDELAEYGRRNWLRGRRLVEPIPGVAGEVGADGALQVVDARGAVRLVRGGTVVVR